MLVVQLCPTVIRWTVAHQALLPMEFSRQEHWRGLSFPSPGDLPYPGITIEAYKSLPSKDSKLVMISGAGHAILNGLEP